MNSKQNIIFFDGYCGLCDRFITEIFLRDKKHHFYFAPLQGPTASRTFNTPVPGDSVIYWKEEKALTKSQAVLEILQDLGGFYSLFGVWRVVPVFLRDLIYDFIASHRYGWFGQSNTCRRPNEQEKIYFLD